MERSTMLTAGRLSVMVAALLVAVALTLGVRPRALAWQFGPAPVDPVGCVLCNGAVTAAAVAPAADTVAFGPPAPPAALPGAVLVAAPLPAASPLDTAVSPPAPPPRA
jgi:hypothetical protein